MVNSSMAKLEVLDDLYTSENPHDINLKKLAQLFNIKQKNLAEALDVNETIISSREYAPGNQALKQWLIIFNLVIDLIYSSYPDAEIGRVKNLMQRWMRSPISDLAQKTPLEVMLEGKTRQVKLLIEQLLAN